MTVPREGKGGGERGRNAAYFSQQQVLSNTPFTFMRVKSFGSLSALPPRLL